MKKTKLTNQLLLASMFLTLVSCNSGTGTKVTPTDTAKRVVALAIDSPSKIVSFEFTKKLVETNDSNGNITEDTTWDHSISFSKKFDKFNLNIISKSLNYSDPENGSSGNGNYNFNVNYTDYSSDYQNPDLLIYFKNSNKTSASSKVKPSVTPPPNTFKDLYQDTTKSDFKTIQKMNNNNNNHNYPKLL